LHIAESKRTKRVTNPNTFYLRETDFALISQEKWHSDYAATNEAFEEWFDEAGRGEECVIITDTSTMARAGLYVLVSPDGSLLSSSSREGPDAPYFNVALRWHKVAS
jgi:predicted ATPase